jgi:hypothetical protein
MALAIKFDEMVARGEVRDYAELARIGHVTRARLTQIANLSLLAPDLQEQILLNEVRGCRLLERQVRSIIAEVDWGRQRQSWRHLLMRCSGA